MIDLETKLRELADKGLLSHLSVYAQWGAHKSPTVFHASVITIHGQGHYDSTDIVEAVLTAIEEAPRQANRKVQQPALVVSKPDKVIRPKDNIRKTPPEQTIVPNLMSLFDE